MRKLLKEILIRLGCCDHKYIVRYEAVPCPEDLPDAQLYRRVVFCSRCGHELQASLVKFTKYGALVITESGVLYKRK